MAYVWSLVILAGGLVLLGVLVVSVLGPVRRCSVVAAALGADLRDRGGMLSARIAALRVRSQQRRA